MYSAIKVNGKKLYEYAREQKEVKAPERQIEIYQMKLLELRSKEAEIVFEISCSKGTYIRTVCETIAEKLNTVGYMKELRRTKVGEFDIDNTISIEDLKKDESLLAKKIITIEEFFENKDKINLNEKELKLFLNGVQLQKDKEDGLYRIYLQSQFIGLGIVQNKKLKRDVIT